MTRLLIARHGNTFEQGETPRRVGKHTDLPLTEKGRDQARQLGRFLSNYELSAVYTSELQRTYEMGVIALSEAKINLKVMPLAMLNEIDYGMDENKTEPEVITRIGKEAIVAWEESSLVPPGWRVEPEEILQSWKKFAGDIARDYPGKTVLAITSNGIARFALSLLSKENRETIHSAKMATGGLSSLVNESKEGWILEFWNQNTSFIKDIH